MAKYYNKTSLIIWLREQIACGNSLPIVNNAGFAYVNTSLYEQQGYSQEESVNMIMDNFACMDDTCYMLDAEDVPADFEELSGEEREGMEFVDLGNDIIMGVWDCENLNSYEIRNTIADIEGFDFAMCETTEGRNGYPERLHGTIDMAACCHSFEEAEKIAIRYGLQLLEGRKRDGWQFWEVRGAAYNAYDRLGIDFENDTRIVADSQELLDEEIAFREEAIREDHKNAIEDAEDEEERNDEIEAMNEEIAELHREADERFGKVDFGKQHITYESGDRLCDFDICDNKCMSFREDVWTYTILLDCDC